MRLPALALAAALFTIALPELRADASSAEVPFWGVSSLTAPAAMAATRAKWPGPFPVEVLSVKDGDTLEVRFTDGLCGKAPCPRQILAVRVLGIDAPEAHRCGKKLWGRSAGMSCAACPAEYALGQQARDFTTGYIRDHPVRVAGVRPDKYGGRIVAGVEVFRGGEWRSLGGALLGARLAVEYDGGRKSKIWCGRG